MINTNKTIRFLNYINTLLSKDAITLLYDSNNIKFERCELFNDFIQSLITLIFDTYMGDDITNDIEQKNHFRWSWAKNLDNFQKEGVIIGDSKLFKYFLDYMLDIYYPMPNKSENPTAHLNIKKMWCYLFDFNNLKSKSDIETFLEAYKLFENSMKIEENP